jgi:YD repeat-containing protein
MSSLHSRSDPPSPGVSRSPISGQTNPRVCERVRPASDGSDRSIGGEEAASYSYDDDGKLTGVTTPAGNVSLTYNRDGRKSQTVLPDGDVERYSYDAAGQLTGIGYYKSSGEAIGDLQYVRDALGRVATIKGARRA